MHSLQIIAGFSQCTPSDIAISNNIRVLMYLLAVALVVFAVKLLIVHKLFVLVPLAIPTILIVLANVLPTLYGIISLISTDICSGKPQLIPEVFVGADFLTKVHDIVIALTVYSFLSMLFMYWVKKKYLLKQYENLFNIWALVFLAFILVLVSWDYVELLLIDFRLNNNIRD